MSIYLTNETPANIGQPNQDGIVPGGVSITSIDDKVVSMDDLGKLCSSMPTALARLYIGSAAFKEVNAIARTNPKTGHSGIKKTLAGGDEIIEPTPYHHIVNETLDLLEFIFKYGDSRDFSVKRWVLNVEKANLNATVHQSHKELVAALESAIDVCKVLNANASLNTIYLFYWKGKVIGGSSPFSLVYTSANLRTLVKDGLFDGCLTGANNNNLFDDTICPLKDRDVNFRQFLYTIPAKIPAGNPLQAFAQYVTVSKSNDSTFNAAQAGATTELLLDRADRNSKVTIAGFTLLVSDHSVNIKPENCDYMIAPTNDAWKGGKTDVPTPLVLSEYGGDGLKYYHRQWVPGSDVIPAMLSNDIFSRQLPTLDATYPYLVAEDFFEAKIMEFSYDIDDDRFETGGCGDLKYLLPIKRRFFDFFTAENLRKMLSITQHKDGGDVTEVSVSLNIPLVNGHTLQLRKNYDVSLAHGRPDVVDCFSGKNTFDLAVFPFYQLQNDQDNVYNVLLGATKPDVSLKFFKDDKEIAVASGKRTTKGTTIYSVHYHISKTSISMIEASVAEDGHTYNAIIVPRFTVIDGAQTAKFCFSIDFGTTNTYVACKEGSNAVVPLEYSESEMQVVTLDKHNPKEFGSFTTLVKREFPPMEISNAGKVKFPIRTATYETDQVVQAFNLFRDCCIGFNYGEDFSKSDTYKTSIKWDRSILSKERIKVFFHQIIWMMKNKSVVNGGSNEFDLVVTYPLSMSLPSQANLFGSIQTAIEQSGCHVQVIKRTESEAPYYVNVNNRKIDFNGPYVNMDIGGGTTDILFHNSASGSSFVFSACFAANDLWGDGVAVGDDPIQRNGILKFFHEKSGLSSTQQTNLDSYRQVVKRSEDVISYLFANESEWNLSKVISSSQYMQALPVIHFSALTFYLAYSLHMAEERAPQYITFTGMGSKYIKLISQSTDLIAEICNAMFRYCGKVFDNDKFASANVKVIFMDNPKEVTARGALTSVSLSRGFLIHPTSELYYGYRAELEDYETKKLTTDDLTNKLQDEVLKFYELFLGAFSDEDFSSTLQDNDLYITTDMVNILREKAVGSYNACSLKQKSDSSAGIRRRVNEPLFFWPLKDALCSLSEALYPQAPKIN